MESHTVDWIVSSIGDWIEKLPVTLLWELNPDNGANNTANQLDIWRSGNFLLKFLANSGQKWG
jgi:hypothetical protein